MIEVAVDSIRVSLMNQQRLVVLKDLHEDRYLPIWIGQFEAEAITIELQEAEQKRPLTHDLLKNTISAVGGRVVHIYINDLRNDIFYARVVIDMGGKQIEVDARPSDAIALAVRTKSPIYVSEAVMGKSAVEPDEDVSNEASATPKPTTAVAKGVAPVAGEDDLAPADDLPSAFADFLNTMKWDEEDPDN